MRGRTEVEIPDHSHSGEEYIVRSHVNVRAVSVLFAALFVAMVGNGVIVPILPHYVETVGASGFWVGLIFSGFSVSTFIFMPFVGRLSDQAGRKAFIAAGLFIYGLISLGFVTAHRPETLTLCRLGQGFAAAMIVPIAQAYVGELSPANGEGKYMGSFSMALLSGFAVGPLMGGFIQDNYGTAAAFYVLSALVFLAFLLVLLFLPELQLHKKVSASAAKGFSDLLRSRIVKGLITFRLTSAMCLGAVIAFVPIFAHNNLHLSSSQIGVIIAANISFGAIVQMPFGVLADKVSRKRLIILGGLVSTGLLLALPSVKTFTQLFVLSLLFGVFGGLLAPATSAIMVEEGRVYGMGSAMSLFNMSMSLGVASGPLLAGWIADRLGVVFIFYFFTVVGIVGLGFFAWCHRRA